MFIVKDPTVTVKSRTIQEGVRKDMDVNEHERLSKFTL
jgi:hypothetical protein